MIPYIMFCKGSSAEGPTNGFDAGAGLQNWLFFGRVITNDGSVRDHNDFVDVDGVVMVMVMMMMMMMVMTFLVTRTRMTKIQVTVGGILGRSFIKIVAAK